MTAICAVWRLILAEIATPSGQEKQLLAAWAAGVMKTIGKD